MRSGEKSACLDIDECSRDGNKICKSQHGEPTECYNLDGDFGCQCIYGFIMEETDGKLTCTDFNECTENQHDCSVDAFCQGTNMKSRFSNCSVLN